MKPRTDRFLHYPAPIPGSVRTGVSLHSHTLNSKESLGFLSGIVRRIQPLGWVAHMENRRRTQAGRALDFSRLWWTPPLGPSQSWTVERRRIEEDLGLRPLVALSDHDSIEAPMALRAIESNAETPISLEWTVPDGDTFFHLGVYNLPQSQAQPLFAEMTAYTRSPSSSRLHELLSELNGHPEVLTVLNHPFWDETGLGKDRHRERLRSFLDRFGYALHALEWNGFRPRRENLATVALSEARSLALVAGGDRHARRPSCILNATAAGSFDEFVDDVRAGREYHVVLMPEHREQLRLRLVEAVCEILRYDPDHGLGWHRWSDRVFYRNDAGGAVPLSALWPLERTPFVVRQFVNLMAMVDVALDHPPMRSAFRLALAEPEEATS